MNTKHWSICLLVLTLILLAALGGITAVIDPFFHYHAPLDSLQYPLEWKLQRYQNDGIMKHFNYDAIITGTSMTENFLASECDELFGTATIKVPFEGASYTELNNNIRTALNANQDIKFIICSIDEGRLFQQRGHMDFDVPHYLYDRNPLNDVQYLLNKEILLMNTSNVLEYTKSGAATTSFDEYCFWGDMAWAAPGRENAMRDFSLNPQARDEAPLTEELRRQIIDNFVADIIQTAKDNPDTQFIYFTPPYSILHWANLWQQGLIGREVEAWLLASRLLLEVENIQLFSFHTDFDTITNLDLYKDPQHYAPEVNSLILRRIHDGEYRLTLDNYESYWQEVYTFYSTYDYSALSGS